MRGIWSTWPRRVALILSFVVLIVAFVAAPAPGQAVTKAQLAKLLLLPDRYAGTYLRKHPEVEAQLKRAEPSIVADWWNTVSNKHAKELIDAVPQIMGNLEGVDYTSRDIANRRYLATALTRSERALTKNPHNDLAIQTVQCLKAIKSAAGGKRSPRRYLVSLTKDRPPLAAIAVGNLDTARLVTFNVPGMGTYTNDMQLWTQSAQNVYDAQGSVGATRRRAVVSWIGYPTPPPGVDATLGDYAAEGAPLLVDELAGFRAVRKKSPTVTLNVVAHSYGSTTAANALASDSSLHIFSFVMLGSAGIENRIRNAAALHAQNVYAGEATDDTEARFGRFSRQDPRSPGFGAVVIAVNGDAKTGLLPVTGHEPILHSNWNDDPFSSAYAHITDVNEFTRKFEQHLTTYGYLDNGTQSLENVAIATTPDANRSLVPVI